MRPYSRVMAEEDRPARPGSSLAESLRLPRWAAVVSGLIGTVIGLLTNLYAPELRQLLESSGRQVSASLVSIVLVALVSSAVTAIVYWLLLRGRQHQALTRGEIAIRSDALGPDLEADVPVVGRSLKFLEARRNSRQVVVLVHGLGLDASDFRAYMAESKFHCVALTMYGFNAEEAHDPDYQPISLAASIALLGYAIAEISRRYPRKQLSLVGFSIGADTALFLANMQSEVLRRVRLHHVVLLDPNINEESLDVSVRVAAIHPDDPMAELRQVFAGAANVSEFRFFCEYFYKITAKNFAQIRRHAEDVIEMWSHSGYGTFLDRLGRLAQLTTSVHLVLSRSYERHLQSVAQGATQRGLEVDLLEVFTRDHFELISPAVLNDLLPRIIK